MKYTKGSIGRVFLLKFEDKDILIDKLSLLVKKERIKAATIIFIGALRKGDLVTGPKKPVIPPQPNKLTFKDGWEVMGIGTVFLNSIGPQIHIHSSMGKKNKVMTGCLRGKSEVFLVIEAVLLELKGIKARKEIDPQTGLNLLRII